MLSQSPRLDSDSAIQSLRNGFMDSTPSPVRVCLALRLGGPSPGLSLLDVERKFTALGYRQEAACLIRTALS
jgi:hypothetical protein